MTTEPRHTRLLTAASLSLLAVTATALTIAFATSTEPRQVIQSPTPTLAEQYAEAWDSLKTEEPTP